MRKPPNELTKDLDEAIERRRPMSADLPLTTPEQHVLRHVQFMSGMLRRYEREPMVARAFLLDLADELERWRNSPLSDVAFSEVKRGTDELKDLVRSLRQGRAS